MSVYCRVGASFISTFLSGCLAAHTLAIHSPRQLFQLTLQASVSYNPCLLILVSGPFQYLASIFFLIEGVLSYFYSQIATFMNNMIKSQGDITILYSVLFIWQLKILLILSGLSSFALGLFFFFKYELK